MPKSPLDVVQSLRSSVNAKLQSFIPGKQNVEKTSTPPPQNDPSNKNQQRSRVPQPPAPPNPQQQQQQVDAWTAAYRDSVWKGGEGEDPTQSSTLAASNRCVDSKNDNSTLMIPTCDSYVPLNMSFNGTVTSGEYPLNFNDRFSPKDTLLSPYDEKTLQSSIGSPLLLGNIRIGRTAVREWKRTSRKGSTDTNGYGTDEEQGNEDTTAFTRFSAYAPKKSGGTSIPSHFFSHSDKISADRTLETLTDLSIPFPRINSPTRNPRKKPAPLPVVPLSLGSSQIPTVSKDSTMYPQSETLLAYEYQSPAQKSSPGNFNTTSPTLPMKGKEAVVQVEQPRISPKRRNFEIPSPPEIHLKDVRRPSPLPALKIRATRTRGASLEHKRPPSIRLTSSGVHRVFNEVKVPVDSDSSSSSSSSKSDSDSDSYDNMWGLKEADDIISIESYAPFAPGNIRPRGKRTRLSIVAEAFSLTPSSPRAQPKVSIPEDNEFFRRYVSTSIDVRERIYGPHIEATEGKHEGSSPYATSQVGSIQQRIPSDEKEEGVRMKPKSPAVDIQAHGGVLAPAQRGQISRLNSPECSLPMKLSASLEAKIENLKRVQEVSPLQMRASSEQVFFSPAPKGINNVVVVPSASIPQSHSGEDLIPISKQGPERRVPSTARVFASSSPMEFNRHVPKNTHEMQEALLDERHVNPRPTSSRIPRRDRHNAGTPTLLRALNDEKQMLNGTDAHPRLSVVLPAVLRRSTSPGSDVPKLPSPPPLKQPRSPTHGNDGFPSQKHLSFRRTSVRAPLSAVVLENEINDRCHANEHDTRDTEVTRTSSPEKQMHTRSPRVKSSTVLSFVQVGPKEPVQPSPIGKTGKEVRAMDSLKSPPSLFNGEDGNGISDIVRTSSARLAYLDRVRTSIGSSEFLGGRENSNNMDTTPLASYALVVTRKTNESTVLDAEDGQRMSPMFFPSNSGNGSPMNSRNIAATRTSPFFGRISSSKNHRLHATSSDEIRESKNIVQQEQQHQQQPQPPQSPHAKRSMSPTMTRCKSPCHLVARDAQAPLRKSGMNSISRSTTVLPLSSSNRVLQASVTQLVDVEPSIVQRQSAVAVIQDGFHRSPQRRSSSRPRRSPQL